MGEKRFRQLRCDVKTKCAHCWAPDVARAAQGGVCCSERVLEGLSTPELSSGGERRLKQLSLTAQLRLHFRHSKENKQRSANKSSGRGDTRLGAAFPALPVAWQLDVEDQLRGWCLFANIWLNITGHIVKAVQSLLEYILGFMCKSVQINGWARAVSGTITGVQVCLQWDAACWRFYICVLY